MKRFIALAACLLLAGCFETIPLTNVFTPVPIECHVAEPERPVMPTDALQQEDALDAKVRALLAETELREGYEIQLVSALRTCTKPIAPEKTK